jgi:hypothetical protein
LASIANWDNSAVLPVEHAKILPRTQEFATLKYAAGRHLVAADPLAAQSIEQKKHYRATRLRANAADGPKTSQIMPPFLRPAARPKCGLSTGRLHVFCE